MSKYVTILCYKSRYGIPAFERTQVFGAKDYDDACHKGGSLLDYNFPEEVNEGYNDWTLSLDDLIKEAESVS